MAAIARTFCRCCLLAALLLAPACASPAGPAALPLPSADRSASSGGEVSQAAGGPTSVASAPSTASPGTGGGTASAQGSGASGGSPSAVPVPVPQQEPSTPADERDGAADIPNEAPGSPAGNSGGGTSPALPSPVRVPLPINTIAGKSFAEGKRRLEEKIRQACGNGELCVSVREVIDPVVPAEPPPLCETVTSVDGASGEFPDQYVEVERGGKIVIRVEERSCPPSEPGSTAGDGAAGGDSDTSDPDPGPPGTAGQPGE